MAAVTLLGHAHYATDLKGGTPLSSSFPTLRPHLREILQLDSENFSIDSTSPPTQAEWDVPHSSRPLPHSMTHRSAFVHGRAVKKLWVYATCDPRSMFSLVFWPSIRALLSVAKA